LVDRRDPRRCDLLPRLFGLKKREDGTMADAKELQEKAEMFERRAENAADLISKHHYREMAAHYRSIAVEHLKVNRDQPAH
jgi:hypothetical protein